MRSISCGAVVSMSALNIVTSAKKPGLR
ncbi:MAG: hypothetical protein RLZZ444_2446, partial [Pseudomonadota bacterium]